MKAMTMKENGLARMSRASFTHDEIAKMSAEEKLIAACLNLANQFVLAEDTANFLGVSVGTLTRWGESGTGLELFELCGLEGYKATEVLGYRRAASSEPREKS
jgi:hypothetical protein